MKTATILITLAALLMQAETASGQTKRSSSVIAEFKKTNPCPATGKISKKCPGYVVDHIQPLCFGGLDDQSNLMWQDKKSSYKKDAFERAACRLKKRCII